MARFGIEKYGTVEINNVASTVTRQIEAQTKVKEGIDYLENGMIVFIDRLSDEITFEKKSGPYLHFSTVRYYEAGSRGSNHFRFEVNENIKELPRLFKLTEGDMFHTNVLKYETSEFADDAALKEALAGGKRVYAYVDGTDGVLSATKTAKSNETCEFIIELSTMPDDTEGFKVLVNKANAVNSTANAKASV